MVMRRDSSVLEVQFFRGAYCDADHHLVVAKVRERPIVSKRTHKFETEMSTLKELNEAKGKEQYRVETSYSFAALENPDDDVHINRAWETVEEHIELEEHKP
jgi:hypothetical protein